MKIKGVQRHVSSHFSNNGNESVCGKSRKTTLLLFSDEPSCKVCLRKLSIPDPIENIAGESFAERNARVAAAYLAAPKTPLNKLASGISRQRVLQILKETGVWKKGIKHVATPKFEDCVRCDSKYLVGKFTEHCEEADHIRSNVKIAVDYDLLRFLVGKKIGTPTIARNFNLASPSSLLRQLDVMGIHRKTNDSNILHVAPDKRREFADAAFAAAMKEYNEIMSQKGI